MLELGKNHGLIMTNVNHRSDNKLRKLDQNQQKQGNVRSVLLSSWVAAMDKWTTVFS